MTEIQPGGDPWSTIGRRGSAQRRAVSESLSPTGSQYGQSQKKALEAIQLLSAPTIQRAKFSVTPKPFTTRIVYSMVFTPPQNANRGITIVKAELAGDSNSYTTLLINGQQRGFATMKDAATMFNNHVIMGLDLVSLGADRQIKVEIEDSVLGDYGGDGYSVTLETLVFWLK